MDIPNRSADTRHGSMRNMTDFGITNCVVCLQWGVARGKARELGKGQITTFLIS